MQVISFTHWQGQKYMIGVFQDYMDIYILVMTMGLTRKLQVLFSSFFGSDDLMFQFTQHFTRVTKHFELGIAGKDLGADLSDMWRHARLVGPVD